MVDFVYDPIIGLKYYYFGNPIYHAELYFQNKRRNRPKVKPISSPNVELQRKMPYSNKRDYKRETIED